MHLVVRQPYNAGLPVKASREARLPKGAHWATLPGCYHPNQVAVDGYHRWREDVDLFAEMGFKVFRMSIGWSQLLPTGLEATPNRAGVEFYRELIDHFVRFCTFIYRKDSFWWYQRCIASNGADLG